MAQSRDPAPGGLAPAPEPELEIIRQIGAWSPPTPRWRDAPARTRISKYAQTHRQQADPTFFQRVRSRIDLIGWILGQSGEGLLNMFEDSTDPRVITYNRVSGPAYRINGPHGVLLRLVYARV
jgi:hypothetical protein